MDFKELGISSNEEIMDTVISLNEIGIYKIKDLNRFIFMAAALDDKVSKNIINKMAVSITNSILGALNMLSFSGIDEIDIVMSGSLNIKEKDSTTIDLLQKKLKECFPSKKFCIKKLNTLPVYGAIKWALEDATGK